MNVGSNVRRLDERVFGATISDHLDTRTTMIVDRCSLIAGLLERSYQLHAPNKVDPVELKIIHVAI